MTLKEESKLGKVTIITTWLILPVVICLSQRLSHACLSTDLSFTRWNRRRLIRPDIIHWDYTPTTYLDNCGNSRANTCLSRLRQWWRSAFISTKPFGPWAIDVVTLDNIAERKRPVPREGNRAGAAGVARHIQQVSDLSAVDCRLNAYSGYNG